ncbi:hypothetical protein CPI31_09310 [Moraxella catarrhalis]|uniref:hypothetical protein n=1 Tax=Moraxella catarrhalis TaxID=480 RepID=UPI00128CA152|nr:hypothetical protein [Moraxella catarrhalis]MPX19726.1 hypothetical protein [Moraxella catarrhalis]
MSKKAIKYIVQLRNNEDVRYSYAQIAKLVEENFGVKVCFQTIAYHYKRNKDIDTSSLSEVKPKSKLVELVEQRKAEKSAPQTTSQPTPTPKPVQKPYRPSNSLLDENGEEPEWMKIANMSVPEFKEYKAKKAAEKAAKKVAEANQNSENQIINYQLVANYFLQFPTYFRCLIFRVAKNSYILFLFISTNNL